MFEPESINNSWLLYAGKIPANAGLSIPFILPTNNVAPVNKAPEFPIHSAGRLRSTCKECWNKQNREKRNPEKERQRGKEYLSNDL